MIYQGDIGIHDIKVGDIDVFEIYQGTKLVYPDNNTVAITFNLNVSGTVTINGYTPVISENNTKFVFTLPVKTDYTATIEAEHYQPKTITENSGYLPTTHDVELQWKIKHDVYTVTFPDNGVKVLFDGVEKGVIASHGLVVLVDDRYSKDSYVVTFEGTKDSIYTVDELTVDDINVPNNGGTYDLTSSTSPVKTNYKRKDYASSTGSVSKGSTYNGYWVETVVNLIASFTVQTTLGSITNKVLTIGNNESTTAKSGTLTVNYTLESGTRIVTANIAQAAGAKVYTDWVLDLQTDGTTVNASGGTRTITANIARRTYKWNDTGTVYSETAIPTLSISGSGTLSGDKINFTSNESVSARSATLTASYVGLSKTVTITQQAGAKVYSAWSAWAVSISASTQTIGASGGSSTITASASRSRTWTWNGVGTTYTDTETAVPTLSGSATGFTLSGNTVTASNNTTTSSRNITITATSNSVSKTVTITQSAGAKVYGNWSGWTINLSADKTSIGATGGTATVSTSATRTRSYTWNGVAGSGGTETGNGSPTLSKVSGDGSWASPKVTYGNNTSISGKSTVIRATIDSTTKDITIAQSAGAKQYGNWSTWIVNISSSGNVVASGGSSNITTSASRTRPWTWNGVAGSGGTETGNGTPTLSKVSGAGSFANNKVTYSNNESTSSRSTVIRATMDTVTKDVTVTQSAGSKTYGSWGAWTVDLTANVTTIHAGGGGCILSASATRSRTWQWNGTGSTYTEQGTGNPTLSKVSGVATLSSSNVTYDNNKSTFSRSSVFRATMDTVTKDITITQSAGSKNYGSWSSWSVSCSASSYNIGASGGSVTIYRSASRSRDYIWNGVPGSGGTEYDSATPSISVTSGAGSLSGTTLSYGNNTSTSSRTTRVTATYMGYTDYCDITQSAGSKTYGNWSAWTVNISASKTKIAADGKDSATITCSASRSRTYQWNGTGTNYTETENGNPTLSKSGDGILSGTTSGSTITYTNNTSTSTRSTRVTATYNSVSKYIDISQYEGAKQYVNDLKYHCVYYGSNPTGNGVDNTTYPHTDTVSGNVSGGGGPSPVWYRLYSTQTWNWNGVSGSGGTETKKYGASNVIILEEVNCSVSYQNDSYDQVAFSIGVKSNPTSSTRTWYVKWRFVNSSNVITTTGTQNSGVYGRLVIQNNQIVTDNAIEIYIDNTNIDNIYEGETSYNNITKKSQLVDFGIPSGASIRHGYSLDIWFNNTSGDGRHTVTINNVSTPNNFVSVSNVYNIVSIISKTTTSNFNRLCNFTMEAGGCTFYITLRIDTQ